MKRIHKIFFCFVSVIVIVFSMFPLSAFAITNPIYTSVSFNKPQLTGNDFLVEFLLYNESTRSYRSKVLYFNSVPESNFTPDVNYEPTYGLTFFDESVRISCSYDSGMNFNYFLVEIFETNKQPNYSSGQHLSSEPFDYGLIHTDYGDGYRCISYHVYGNVSSISGQLSQIPSTATTEFIVEYGESASIHNTIISLYQLIGRMGYADAMFYDKVDDYLSSLQSIVDNIYAQDTVTQQHIVDLLSFVRIISADVILIRDDLLKQYNELLEQGKSLDDINSKLHDINVTVAMMNVLVQEIHDYVYFIWESTLYIQGYCEEIRNILSAGSDKEQPTTQDPSQFDNYYDVENSLVGGGANDVTGAIQVQMNNNAMSVIWNMVEQFLNSHGKVIGFVLTILSFGLVALILGR